MPTQVESTYRSLLAHLRQQALVASCQELLGWDELTQMPDGASEYRGRQLAWLAGQHHTLATDPRLGDWLGLLEQSALVADAASDAAVNIREVRRQYDRLTKLPRQLVEQLALLVTAGQQHWKVARERNDFGRFQPWLEQIVLLKREEALCLGATPVLYDALLAEYEPGFASAELNQMFAELGRELVALLAEVRTLQDQCPTKARPDLLRQGFDVPKQRQFCRELAAAVGFDSGRGMIDLAVHPFTSLLGPSDVRIALRFDALDLREGIFGTLHELGHALYDQCLPYEHHGLPIGEAASLSIHESQGRLWENAVGRSVGFWQCFLPRLTELFPQQFAHVTHIDLWRAVNFVEPSLNRVRADEVTYNLHILIRYELEQALLSGDLPVADLPAAWNERYEQWLGIRPASDRDGCLQDGHWAAGMFGYFPTYTLGNLAAAQLVTTAESQIGSLHEHVAAGNFGELRNWLAANVYQHGRRYSTRELIRRATEQAFDHQQFIARLRTRHLEAWSA
jgi:carboxypeptidase Taq